MPPCKLDGAGEANKETLHNNNVPQNWNISNGHHPPILRYEEGDLDACESISIAKDVVLWYTLKSTQKPATAAARVMRQCVSEMLSKHQYRFNGMVNRLGIDERTGYETFTGVADAVFSDQQINWGRVVALCAFASRLAQYCKENGMGHYADDIAKHLGRYISEELLQWIKDHGGWSDFVKQFPDRNGIDNRVWRGLVATAAVGLGALATIVAAK